MAQNTASEPKNPERELTLIGHLDELRTRLVIAVGALVVTTMVSIFFAKPVLEVLIKPVSFSLPGPAEESADFQVLEVIVGPDGALRIDPARIGELKTIEQLVFVSPVGADDTQTTHPVPVATGSGSPSMLYLSPLDPFMMQLKVAIIMGILLSLPIWVWQIWLFVAPGLTGNEKRVVRPMLAGAVLLFPVGAAFAYGMFYLIIPVMRRYAVEGIDPIYNLRDYLKIMTNMMIAFGFIFELPLVVAIMARVGIVTPAFLRHYRRHIYILLAFLSMIMTPADPISMLIALVPLIGLFEISIYIAHVMMMIRARSEEEEN